MKKHEKEYWLSVVLAFLIGVAFAMHTRELRIASAFVNGVIISEVHESWVWSK
jgi:hypothetical protein